MDFGAGGFSIAPVLSAVRVVDWEQSPAFAAVDAACDAVLQLYGARHGFDMYGKGYQDDGKSLQLLEVYRKLHDDLRQSFISGRATARDQTQEGTTLLHVSLCFMKARSSRRC